MLMTYLFWYAASVDGVVGLAMGDFLFELIYSN